MHAIEIGSFSQKLLTKSLLKALLLPTQFKTGFVGKNHLSGLRLYIGLLFLFTNKELKLIKEFYNKNLDLFPQSSVLR